MARVRFSIGPGDRVLWFLAWNPRWVIAIAVIVAAAAWYSLHSPWAVLAGLLLMWPWLAGVRLVRRRTPEIHKEQLGSLHRDVLTRIDADSTTATVFILDPHFEQPHGVLKTAAETHFLVLALAEHALYIFEPVLATWRTLTFEPLSCGLKEYPYQEIRTVGVVDDNILLKLPLGQEVRFEIGPIAVKVANDLRSRISPYGRNARPHLPNRTGAAPAADLSVGPAREGPILSRDAGEPTEEPPADEPRYCFIRQSNLNRILEHSGHLDDLMEILSVPGKVGYLRGMDVASKQRALEECVEAYRNSATSRWRGVEFLEVIAASIFRMSRETDRRDFKTFKKRYVERKVFHAVSREDDLAEPVERWLRQCGMQPHSEVEIGRNRADLVGVSESREILIVELKNDYSQFKRAFNQLATFAEYSHKVYVACTPAFGAEYLDSTLENSTTVAHWEPDALTRQLEKEGVGLLLV